MGLADGFPMSLAWGFFFRAIISGDSKPRRSARPANPQRTITSALAEWRKECFEQDNQVREDFERGKSPEESGRRDWSQRHYTRELFREMQAWTHQRRFFARPWLGRKQSQSTLQTPSDQSSQSRKSCQCNNPDYEVRLRERGGYMRKSPLDITDTSQDLCRTLLEKEQTVPQNTLFRDDLFDETCDSARGRNEAMNVRDITPLICPSAQVLRS